MRGELLQMAAELARRGEPFALATVVARKAPISAQIGDTALVTGKGAFHGWVGGSCTRPTVEEQAARALEDGRPRRVLLDPDPGAQQREDVIVFPMTCHSGGSVEIHIQPVMPMPQLLVFGVSPIARALARLAKAMDYRVYGVDPTADASAFPDADAVATEPRALEIERTSAPLLAVVATQGQWDEDAILAALAHEPDYLGVVASRKRFGEMRSVLEGKAPKTALDAIRNPAGIDLGARRPEEIAISILAEIVKERQAAAPTTEAQSPGPATGEARDPICGMSVRIADAAHRARHEDQEFFFCGAGCRERFLANPESYLAASGGP